MNCSIYSTEGYRGMALLCTAAEIETLYARHCTADLDPPSPSTSITVSKNAPRPSVRLGEYVNSTIIEIVFEKKRYESMIVNKRANGKEPNLYVHVPSRLTGGRKRYIHFKPQHGCSKSFRNCVLHKIIDIVMSWKSPSDPDRWCESSLDIWKDWIVAALRFPSLKMRSKPVIHENVSSYPIRDNSIIIPLHELFLGGPTEVPSIHIRRARNTKNGRPRLLITFPGAIFADNKIRQKSMKFRFDRDNKWIRVIERYVKAAVYTCKTIEDARVWYMKGDFVHRINQLCETN